MAPLSLGRLGGGGVTYPRIASAPAAIAWVSRDLRDLIDGVLGGTQEQIGSIIESLARYHGPASLLARTLPTGRAVFWVLVILAAFLVFNFS